MGSPKNLGGIVNNSRTFGIATISFIQGDNAETIQKRLIYRHIAWLTALRYQLRLLKEWEHTEDRVKGLYLPTMCEAYYNSLDNEVMHFISEEEFKAYKTKSNMAAQILATQAKELQTLKDQNYFDNFRHMELHKLLGTFYDDQGRSERIKNFPFPRQYASVAYWTCLVFSLVIPFGMLSIFENTTKTHSIWLTIPFSALIIWIFFLMGKIGDYSENPFEGTYNDVPISAIARGIEIDLREMINDSGIPKPIASTNGFLM